MSIKKKHQIISEHGADTERKKRFPRIPFMRILGAALILGGVALIGGSVLLNMQQDAVRREAIERFRMQRIKSVESTAARITEKPVSGEGENGPISDNVVYFEGDDEIICILRIPKIDSENPVVEGTTKSALKAALGHQEGTAYPGDVGNCVIAGHRNYTFGKYFNRLDEVEIGDMIYVDYPDETLSYRVSGIKTVEPDDLSVLEQGDSEVLTLYTCTPIYVATHRLVITADRI